MKVLLHLSALLGQSSESETENALQTDIDHVFELLFNDPAAFAAEYLSGFAINLVAALAIYIMGRWAAKLIARVVRKMIVRANIDETLGKFLAHIIYMVLMAMVIIAALGKLGVPTTSFAAILAAAGFAIGFALKDSLGNFASGVMLIMFQPFKVDDFVEAGGVSGTVEEIRIFNTFMRTGDNRQIIIPNSAIADSTITNYSAKTTRRIDLVVGCGYGDDLKAVKEFLESLVNADDRVLDDPQPLVAVSELGDSSVNLVVRPWVNSSDYWTVRCELTEAIKLGFDERGFNIPYPTRDINVTNTAA